MRFSNTPKKDSLFRMYFGHVSACTMRGGGKGSAGATISGASIKAITDALKDALLLEDTAGALGDTKERLVRIEAQLTVFVTKIANVELQMAAMAAGGASREVGAGPPKGRARNRAWERMLLSVAPLKIEQLKLVSSRAGKELYAFVAACTVQLINNEAIIGGNEDIGGFIVKYCLHQSKVTRSSYDLIKGELLDVQLGEAGGRTFAPLRTKVVELLGTDDGHARKPVHSFLTNMAKYSRAIFVGWLVERICQALIEHHNIDLQDQDTQISVRNGHLAALWVPCAQGKRLKPDPPASFELHHSRPASESL